MIRDWIFGITILLLLILVGWLLFRSPDMTIREIYSRDTIIVKEPIMVEAPAKIKYKTKVVVDTLREIREAVDSTSWIACIDTTFPKVDISVCYLHPENKFNIGLRFVPDTIEKVTYIEKPIIKYEQRPVKWYEEVYKIGGGVLVGIVIGILAHK